MALAPVITRRSNRITLNVIHDQAVTLPPNDTPPRVQWTHGTNAPTVAENLTMAGWVEGAHSTFDDTWFGRMTEITFTRPLVEVPD